MNHLPWSERLDERLYRRRKESFRIYVLSVLILAASLPLCLCAQQQRSPSLWDGTWHLDTTRSSPDAAEPGVPQSYRFTVSRDATGAKFFRWEIPELGEVVFGRADGRPLKIVRRKPTPGMTLAITAVGGEVLTYKLHKSGCLFGAGRMMLVDSGKAWIDLTWPAGRQDLASVLTYVKAPVSVTKVAAESSDPKPASLIHPQIESHGSKLLGVMYLAEGFRPHPTAILFHGFPGFEQNLDLAQDLRRAGWNVLAMHYRGSWGVQGQFSFRNCVQDADAQVAYLLANAESLRVDPERIVVIGHSMGGLVAAAAAAHAPEVKAAVLISAWNIGAPRDDEAAEAKALASGENLSPISGTDGATLAHEEFTYRTELDLQRLAPALASRPVLLITANDHSDQFASPFAAALQSAGDRQVTTVHFQTDHAYSDRRDELADVVLAFLKHPHQKWR